MSPDEPPPPPGGTIPRAVVAASDTSPAAGGGATAVPQRVTIDTLLRGQVTLLQPARGFRSSLDPVLLAAFVKAPLGRFVDIGCGTGALAFLLAAADPLASGIAVEIQARLATMATAGLARNAFAARLRILHADVRQVTGRPPLARASFDLVATNPPYRAVSTGVPSPDPERAQANHEISLTMDEWLDAAATLVKPEGRVAVVYPAERQRDLLSGLWRRGFRAVRLRPVRPRADRPASRVLVEARFAATAPSLVEEPALVLHNHDGTYTHEMRILLREESPSGDGPR